MQAPVFSKSVIIRFEEDLTLLERGFLQPESFIG